ncbi:MAG: molybdopterin-dependent oxidoreductase [Amphiplicatus sp.]
MADGGDIRRVRSVCPYCGVGCGVIVESAAHAAAPAAIVRGDPDHPANFGRLCSKGAALGETIGREDRLLYPTIGGARVSWDEATGAIAEKFNDVIAAHGPEAVAFYVSGQILIEDYYVANKLMKGFIGSANIDTNSRLCMASSVAGHKRAFGSDTVPGCYEDLERADLIVLVGSNLAWCHPILYQRIEAARRSRPGMKIVVIDPRATATSEGADLWLAVSPGGDVALFQGLLAALAAAGAADQRFIAEHTNGVEEALAAAAPYDLQHTARETGVDEKTLAFFFDLFRRNRRTVTVYSQGVNQAADGVDRVNAIINCHLLTGRIGEPGMGPFSVTGQPNAMGGREVGGLSNQLASHMELGEPRHRALLRRFWDAPRLAERPGLKAVDLFEAVHEGRVKALWIMATNPVVSMPDADRVREALRRCELVILSDVVANTDTAGVADILLPSTAWGEKNGMATNSERRMSRQRAFLAPPGEARDDWRQMCGVAAKMGWGAAFDYGGAGEVFREYADLCSLDNSGSRDLDLAGLCGMDAAGYNDFAPTQWPVPAGARAGAARLFGDGRFFTRDGRANFVAPAARAPAAPEPDYPYTLNTGRIRDQWHTMTRTGRTSRLFRHIAEPFVEISPEDAAREGLKEAEIARIVSPRGVMLARVLVTKRQPVGSLFAPMHWTDEFSSKGRVDALVAPLVDPISGQPALKSARVRVERFNAAWYGFAALAAPVFSTLRAPVEADYWAKARIEGGARFEMAGLSALDSAAGEAIAGRLFRAFVDERARGALASTTDVAAGRHSCAVFQGDVLMGALFLAREPVGAARAFVLEHIGRRLSPEARQGVLAGRPGGAGVDRGAIVCSCMNVGANEIAAAVARGCRTIDEVGLATGAGTNCGSCRSEIGRFTPEVEHAQA